MNGSTKAKIDADNIGGINQHIGIDCKAAWGPDADRHVKVLITIQLAGSNFALYRFQSCMNRRHLRWSAEELRLIFIECRM